MVTAYLQSRHSGKMSCRPIPWPRRLICAVRCHQFLVYPYSILYDGRKRIYRQHHQLNLGYVAMENKNTGLTFLGLLISVILLVALVFMFQANFTGRGLSEVGQQYLLVEPTGEEDEHDAAESDGHGEEGAGEEGAAEGDAADAESGGDAGQD